MPSVIHSQQYLKEAYAALGKAHYSTPRDANVVCPHEDWFVREYIPHLDKITLPYVAETYDCDDFVDEARLLLTRSLCITPEFRGKGHSLAYVEGAIRGDLNGVRDGMHATGLIRFSNGRLCFFEPQPSTQRLTDAKDACAAGIFIPRECRL